MAKPGIVEPGGFDAGVIPRSRQAAPEPRRSVNYSELVEGGAPEPVEVGQPIFSPNPTAAPMSNSTFDPGARQASLQVSAPPPDPQAASKIQELEHQNGELIRSIGAMREDFTRQLQEMNLRQDLRHVASAQAQPQAMPPLPPGIDPEAQMTWGQFVAVANNVFPVMQGNAEAQGIRASWGVSPEEENAVLTAFPEVQSLREPERTRYIQRAAALRRPTAATAPPTLAPTNAANGRPEGPTRPVTTVPAADLATAAPTIGEPSTQDPIMQARMDYERAKSSTPRTWGERNHRLAAMKAASQRIEQLQGVTEEILRGNKMQQKG